MEIHVLICVHYQYISGFNLGGENILLLGVYFPGGGGGGSFDTR